MIAAVLDSTVLSNFAHIRQARLIEIAFDQPVTVAAVMLELDGGVQSGRVPATDWSWLPVIELMKPNLRTQIR